MTSYIPGNTSIGGFANDTLTAIELRVISNLIQAQGLAGGNSNADQLSTLRNDQAFELGIVPPVIPGS